MPLTTRRHFLATGTGCLVATTLTGCGTIFYPERRGQPAGDLDWKVVALDAVGLLFFFVPGVIAFAVDFSNGTIYLPPRRHYAEIDGHPPELATVSVPRDEISPERLSRVVSAHSGRDVTLRTGEYESRPLGSIDEFWSTRDRLAAGV